MPESGRDSNGGHARVPALRARTWRARDVGIDIDRAETDGGSDDFLGERERGEREREEKQEQERSDVCACGGRDTERLTGKRIHAQEFGEDGTITRRRKKKKRTREREGERSENGGLQRPKKQPTTRLSRARFDKSDPGVETVYVRVRAVD